MPQSIVVAIEGSWHTMLKQLLAQLKTELQLPKCLQVVGYLRRMQAFSSTELRLIFLQSRDSWLTRILANIPSDDGKFMLFIVNCIESLIFELAQQHLTKTIELTRVNLFTIVTQYKATFSDDETDDKQGDFSHLFCSWLNEKVLNFVFFML